eukprot:GFKZ01012167.1.p1 GENE.GFKZ01012167.1~~GFKZ01012167.1.p1  ORF type:complete len:117 (+),score=6.01 GFKZ01012167.1:178-528(+)
MLLMMATRGASGAWSVVLGKPRVRHQDMTGWRTEHYCDFESITKFRLSEDLVIFGCTQHCTSGLKSKSTPLGGTTKNATKHIGTVIVADRLPALPYTWELVSFTRIRLQCAISAVI